MHRSPWAGAIRAAVTLILLLAFLVVGPAPAAHAATTTIRACDLGSFDDELDLQRAMNLADNETDRPGQDTIVLQPDCVYTFTEPVGETGPIDALPAIDTNLRIRGNGATIQMQEGTEHLVDHLIRVTRTGNLRLEDVTLQNNFADWRFGGAALYNIGVATLDGVEVTDADTGAVFNHWDGTMTVLDSNFHDNRRAANSGAAIENQGILFVDGSRFTNNVVATSLESNHHNGGAIWIGTQGAALITDSVFDRNSAFAFGGAIFSFGTVSVSNSTFTNNTGVGGAITDWTGRLIVSKSYFESNRSFGEAGAIYAGHDATITNSTFYRNRALREGGAVFGHTGSNLSITNATFAENDSDTDVGDAVSHHGNSGNTKNSIFAGHSHACDQVPHGGENIVDVFDPTCSGGFRLGDPVLLAPALNCGKTKTMRLGPGSKAVDKAISTSCFAADQRGEPRPAGPFCDIGAFEDQIPTAPGGPLLSSGVNPSNTGAFRIAWGSSSDPDGPVQYKLYHRDADDGAASLLATTASTAATIAENEGTFAYHVVAADGNHEVSSSTLTGIVVDKTAPGVPTLTADRAPDYEPADGSNGWYRSAVTVTIADTGDPVLGDGSDGSGVAFVTPSPMFDTSGAHTAAGIATDAAGNSSAQAQLTVHVDAEPPAIGFTSCPETVLLGHAAAATWTASDPSSGLATPASGQIALDTLTIGHKSVVAEAVDNVGFSASATCAFDVIFDFAGFFVPVDNPPSVNTFAPGRVVTVAFSLDGNQGLDVLEAGHPQSTQVPCDSFGEQTAGEPAMATGQGFMYSGGRYTYPWKTSTSWRGTCRQLVVKLIDGTYHRANFDFR